MNVGKLRVGVVVAAALVIAGLVTGGNAAAAAPAHQHSAAKLSGNTYVTTAPGLAGTLIGAGVLPLPAPPAGFRLKVSHGLVATYRFPIVGGNPDLAGPSGDILHSGGIFFLSAKAHLALTNFDIDLAKATVFATRVNGAPARVPVLDLDFSKLSVGQRGGATVLSHIPAKLDPAAAGALNSTFGLGLPTDRSLVFGGAVVALR